MRRDEVLCPSLGHVSSPCLNSISIFCSLALSETGGEGKSSQSIYSNFVLHKQVNAGKKGLKGSMNRHLALSIMIHKSLLTNLVR